MTLNIPGEFDNVLNEAVASGAFADQEAALRHALELLAEEQHARTAHESSASLHRSHEAWAERFREFIARHKPTGHPVDDSRESIYPDRL